MWLCVRQPACSSPCAVPTPDQALLNYKTVTATLSDPLFSSSHLSKERVTFSSTAPQQSSTQRARTFPRVAVSSVLCSPQEHPFPLRVPYSRLKRKQHCPSVASTPFFALLLWLIGVRKHARAVDRRANVFVSTCHTGEWF
ncbi:hypothetical protein L596_030846 [Steinernema carpocapsae]|uniref:Uncharacterized protein n=1 Tax=Steinernema carpocapsae TaxID=34508 RepID=A0A4U5LNB4_STECR|nr:hypothetical protein L596_030846 [Steinernema carpocapsae]